ncbi:hypothetical protein AB0M44_41265 [Streptosporangium subroseum]|uniref:hypothetical protein n=1 Tax=Streptosporangium subroseum TaxID=106412 RepID=UPI0034432240
MITTESRRPVRTIALPRRNHHGGHSPAWLLVQAAQLSWEIHSILSLIHGARLIPPPFWAVCGQVALSSVASW